MMQARQWTTGTVAVLLLAVVVGPALPAIALADSTETKTLTVVGIAAGTDDTARHIAQLEARRQAVYEGCELYVQSSTLVENYQVVRDQILMKVNGYIIDSKILEEWVEGEYSKCKLRATVRVGQLKADLQQLPELWRAVGKPRCMLLFTEDANAADNKDPVVGGACQTALERIFKREWDLELIDYDTAEAAKDRDVVDATMNNDSAKLAAFARRLNAELLVYGQAKATPLGPLDQRGVRLYNYRMDLQLRLIKADSGQVLASLPYSVRAYNTMSPICDDGGFVKLADEVKRTLLDDLLNAWRNEATGTRTYNLTLGPCSYDEWKDVIKPAIDALPGRPENEQVVIKREYSNSQVTANVYWKYSLDTFADALRKLQIEGLRFEIASESENALVVNVVR